MFNGLQNASDFGDSVGWRQKLNSANESKKY